LSTGNRFTQSAGSPQTHNAQREQELHRTVPEIYERYWRLPYHRHGCRIPETVKLRVMTTMKFAYYPGCTLKSDARELGEAAVASMAALGVDLVELSNWNCCGAVYCLSEDDLIHQVAPVRILIRAKEEGFDKLVTICSMCYNTLARANLMVRRDAEKRKTINLFMEEEIDYEGEIEVLHLLSFIDQIIGWERLGEAVKASLRGMKVAPYYGCTLQRPREIGIEPTGSFGLMTRLLETLGATVVPFPAADHCCGSYQVLGNPEAAQNAVLTILESARLAGAEALAVSCPLCEFNLGKKQVALKEAKKISKCTPVFYFTHLLAVALGLVANVRNFGGEIK
jgi:heterodisulfide reductase subunit B